MLSINDLTIKYPDSTTAINGFSASIEKGERTALIGANGAGKTTLLLAVMGVLPIHSGSITVCGTPLTAKTRADIIANAGLLFQNPDDQLFMPTINEDIIFGPMNMGKSRATAQVLADTILSSLGIAHLAAKPAFKLSGGEKRLAALASILVMQPSLLLLDEPTAFLDPLSRRGLINRLRALEESMLIATHDLAFAAELCKRVIIIKGGTLLVTAGIDALYDTELMQNAALEAITRSV